MLVFDVGCHVGEDTAFYLKKGFAVVGVEANPALCHHLKRRFAQEITEGRFVLVEKAIAPHNGEITFYANETTVWGTIDAAFAQRNAAVGAPSTKIAVHCTTFDALLREFGIPYYLKVDIEGADKLCLLGLKACNKRPRYIQSRMTKRN